MSLEKIFKETSKTTLRDKISSKLLGTTVGNALLKEISKNAEKQMLDNKITGVGIKKGTSLAIGGTLVASSLYGGYRDSEHIGKAGKISAGNLANTINTVTSPELNDISAILDKNPALQERFAKENLKPSQSGVDPSIVFALHELRNGGV